MASLDRILAYPRTHWPLGLMLVLLHVALWWDFGSGHSRAMMLAHLGAFLIWQPVWHRERRFDPRGAVVFVLLTLGFVYWLNWWFILVWLVLLIGLLGGHVFVDRRERYAYLVGLVVVTSELLIAAIPPMFRIPVGHEITMLFGYGLLGLGLTPVLMPLAPAQESEGPGVDPIHGLTLSLVTTILVLGSLLVMYSAQVEYPVALFRTLLAMAGFLLAIGWMLSPRLGFSGLGYLWTRYLLNIGTPFEEWLARLSALARSGDSPEAFLEGAMDQLQALPWVAGVQWDADSGGPEQRGRETAHTTRIDAQGLGVCIYTARAPGATLLFHGRLLVQLIGHFHAAKQAELALARQTRLKAIHETGARVTHDIKNLLQSLDTMSAAVEQSRSDRAGGVLELLKRQLPHLSRRLRLSLEKLQSPEQTAVAHGRLEAWWEAFTARNADTHIGVEADIRANPDIPTECFDSVVENLLENARIKRQSDPALDVSVKLVATEDALRLVVCDSGSPIAAETARALFSNPVSSKSGLGIGLYQAAKQARQAGFELSLRHNRPGGVCFELSKVQ